MSSSEPYVAIGSEPESGDEAASRVASSPAPGPEQRSDVETAVAAGVPAGESHGHGPVGPAPSAEDEGEERGADQDPVAEDAPLATAPAVPGSDDAPEIDHEQVARDLEELTAKAAKADEYLELAQRTKADFENYRKRAAREVAAAQERGVVKLARELLPAIDNLDRAVAAGDDLDLAGADNGTTANLVSGIRLVYADVIAALGRVGIEPYSPRGEVFDPQHHEAVAQQPFEGAEPGTIAEVYQCGYRLGEFVLRPARVLVAG